MKNKKILISALLLCALFPLFLGNASAVDTSLSDITDRGTIKIATSSGYSPFEDLNTTTDELYGFDIAFGEYIGEQLGVTVEWSDVGFTGILTGLDSGTYDCVLAAIGIIPERELQYNFTRWYFESEQAVLLLASNPKNITNEATLNTTGVKVGYQTGTTSNWYAEGELTATTQSALDTVPLAISQLTAGTLDVVLCDWAVAFSAVEQNENLKIEYTFWKEYFGIPVKIGADALRIRLDEIINDLLGDDPDNPEISEDYNEMYEEWIGAPAPGYEEFSIPGFPLVALVVAVPLTVGIIARKRK